MGNKSDIASFQGATHVKPATGLKKKSLGSLMNRLDQLSLLLN
jgi:hypothetical protein